MRKALVNIAPVDVQANWMKDCFPYPHPEEPPQVGFTRLANSMSISGRPEIEGGVLKDEGEENSRDSGLPRPSRRVLRTLLRMRKPFTRSPWVGMAGTRRQLLGAVAALVFEPIAAFAAHGASPLKVVETTILDAPPGKVWAVVSDFAHADWLPGVARIEASGEDVPDQARRRLIMADGGVIEELLTKRDAERMLLGVHREGDDVKRLPATNYTALITLRPAEDGKTQVEWKARFYRGYPNNDPPPELNDDVAIAEVTTMQRAYLAALKAKVEASVPSPRQ